MDARTRIAQTLAAAAVLTSLAMPSHAIQAASPAPAPFDACDAVGVRAAAGLIGSPIRNSAPNYRQSASTPRQQALCVYNGVNNGQLSVLLLRFGTTASERDSFSAFRSSYEKAAAGMYGKPVTTTQGDATIVTFQGENGQVLDVAAYTSTAAARITLAFGKARASELNSLALSLVRATYGPAPTPSPSADPISAPCGRRATHAGYRG